MALGLILFAFYMLSDFYFWVKFIATYLVLRWRQITVRKRFDLYDFKVDTGATKLGFLIPLEEKALESPLPEEHLQEATDEVFIYGINSKSEHVVLQISRTCNNEAEAWIFLKLSDGRQYELQETSGYQKSYGGKCETFTCGGLQMHYLSAMRRWRIVFCGMLKEVPVDKNSKPEEVFVKLNFLWTASSEVYDFTSEFNVKETAKALARANWSQFFPPVDKMVDILNTYCQSGVIHGIVSVEDQPDEEIYLFGERVRYIGKSPYIPGCKYKHILGVSPENGLVVHLGKASVRDTFHNLTFGFIVDPNASNHTIEDGIIISRLSKTPEPGHDLTASFKAGEKRYEMCGSFVEDVIRAKSDTWNGEVEFSKISFEIDGCKGTGFMVTGQISDRPAKKIRSTPPVFPKARPLTVSFTNPIAQLTEVSGGKGSSLGKLTELSAKLESFVVPKGIVVTTAAYSEFLTNDIIRKIENLKDIVYGNTKGEVQEASRIVASAIEKSNLPPKISKEIEEKLNEIFGGKINQHRFAVRSSATGEDTDQMSAAGQMDTFLGMQGLEQIFTAVKKCWASQFSHIAVGYKRQNGQILNSPMAVVIQEMVECEAAGVLFTCDPVTNNPSVIVITGNYGLGESVVSGSEEPDTIVLKKCRNDEVEVKSVTIGLKQHRIDMTDTKISGGEETVVQDVPEDQRNECCISKEMIEQLGKLSLKIEDHYKSARDIEWGICKNTIYILQSRPVTTGATVTDYEIMHEFDAALRCEGDYFTMSNIGEVMPGAVSPLGLDIALKLFLSSAKKMHTRNDHNKFCLTTYFPSGLVPFYNHLVASVIELITYMGSADSIMGQCLMVAVFGRILDDPGLTALSKYRVSTTTESSIVQKFLLFRDLFFCGFGVNAIKRKVFKFRFPTAKCATALETFNAILDNCNHMNEPYGKHIICSEVSAAWNIYIFTVLGNAYGSVDTEVYSDFARLLSTTSNVESADVPSAMQSLAHAIVKDIKAEDFKSMSLEEAQEWLENSSKFAGYKYREFIKRHGHRCLKEFDVYSKPWRDDTKTLIRLLQNMAGSCSEFKEKKDDSSKMLSELKVPLTFKSRILLKFLLPNCQRGVRRRETCKSIVIKAMDNYKIALYDLSRKMVAEGYLPDTDLLYYMTVDEIYDLLHTRNPRLIARAIHRRKLQPLLENLKFPEIFKGRPVPDSEDKDDGSEYVADLTMKGIPVSRGTAKGYARVALNLEEAALLKPGEILITYGTDIGWTPYFPILAGVVTELGGLISHGAVVSREYGLPCVVGLHGATKKFATGDYVLLDGSKGILQRLSAPEKEV